MSGTGAHREGQPAAETLQRAAQEAIDAARAFLDLAEEMVRDPAVLNQAVDTVGALARAVAGQFMAGREAPANSDGEGGIDAGDDGVEHIRVD